MISILVAGVLIALAVLCVAVAAGKMQAFKAPKDKTVVTKADKLFAKISGVLAAVFALSLVIIPPSIRTVEAGEVAVVKELGEAKEVRSAGTYLDFWVTRKYVIYDATVQNLNIDASAYSKDAQTMSINMTVQYKINPDQAVDIATKYGSLDTLSNRIESVSIERTKSILSSYSAMEIIENRASISPQVEQMIQNTISDQYYVTIVASVLTNIDFSDAFEATVENKMIAEQEVLTAEYEKEKAIIAAEQQLEVARLEAQAIVAEAEAKAKSVELAAKAQAQAIAVKSVEVARMLGFNILENKVGDETLYTIDFNGRSAEEIALISDYLKYVEYLDTWNGELPSTILSGENGVSILLPQA